MNKRQKKHYYTENRAKLQTNVQMVKQGDKVYDSPKDLLVDSGYTESSAIRTLSDPKRNIAIRDLLADIWDIETVVKDMKDIQGKATDSEQYGNALKAIDMRLKMGGDYSAVKQEMEISGVVKHEHELTGGTDYLKFRQKQLDSKEIIEGEVING